MNGTKNPENAGPSDSAGTPHCNEPASPRQLTKDEICCSCISCFPDCLQRCASLKLFIFMVCLLLCFSAATLAVFEGLVTTIETRYQLSASEIGLSASVFTAGTAVSTVVVTHFGGRPTSRRPVWIALGGLCLALGAALHALPQFILSPYQPPSSLILTSPQDGNSSEFPAGLCRADAGERAGEGGSCQAEDRQVLMDNNIAYIIIIVGQTILGVGYGPLVPLTLAYVDDNATRGTTGLASGILESMFGLGAIVGFQIASAVVTLWVDFYRVDVATVTGLTPGDHGWVGAWWLGMLIEAVAFFVLALPLFGFPRRIPGSHQDKGDDLKKNGEIGLDGKDGTEVVKTSAIKELKEWPHSVWRLLKNTVFLLACLSFITEGALVYSLAAFFPKYMQVQFGLDVFSANLIAGFAFVPPWALGALIGGIIVKKWSPGLQGSAVMGVVSALLACSFAVVLIFVGCDNPPIAGVTVGYQGNDLGPTASLSSACNSHCSCPEETTYAPYCGPDGITYFSSCYAGCSQAENETYSDCSCLMSDPISTPSDVTVTSTPSTISHGHCPYTCTNKVAFVVLMVLWAISLSSATSPRIIVIVSSVQPADKSLALGISRVLMLLFGSLPFPFLYGVCIDSACLVWQTLCGERGSCSIYDIERFRRIIYALTATLIALQCLAFAVIWLVARARQRRGVDYTQGRRKPKGEVAGTTESAAGKDGAKMSPSRGSQNEADAREDAF